MQLARRFSNESRETAPEDELEALALRFMLQWCTFAPPNLRASSTAGQTWQVSGYEDYCQTNKKQSRSRMNAG